MCILYIYQVICILEVCHSSPSHCMCSGSSLKKRYPTGPSAPCWSKILRCKYRICLSRVLKKRPQVCHREIHVSGVFALRELLNFRKGDKMDISKPNDSCGIQ